MSFARVHPQTCRHCPSYSIANDDLQKGLSLNLQLQTLSFWRRIITKLSQPASRKIFVLKFDSQCPVINFFVGPIYAFKRVFYLWTTELILRISKTQQAGYYQLDIQMKVPQTKWKKAFSPPTCNLLKP